MRLLPSILAVGCLSLAQSSFGAISYSGVQDVNIPISFGGVYIDFTNSNQANQYNVETSDDGSWEFNFFFGGAAVGTSDTLLPVTAGATTNSRIVNQTTGTLIDGTDTYPPGPPGFSGSTSHMAGTVTPGYFTSVSNGSTAGTSYIGFVLNPGVDDYYGWARVTLNDDGATGTLHDWAWDIDGNAIPVGVIPEPSVPGLTAFLLLSAAILRRKRRSGSMAPATA